MNRLHLYLWAEDHPMGIFVSMYNSWDAIISSIKLWTNPDHVFTVIEEEI